MRILFVEARFKEKIKLGKKILKELEKFNSIGLIATVQFIGHLNGIKNELKKEGKQVIISEPSKYAIYPGQILGCDISAAISIQDKVDCFLYIGDGKFHPLGVAIQTNKPVIAFNPYNRKIAQISEEEKRLWLKKQAARIAKVKDAKILGLLVSTKPGQFKLKAAQELKKKLEKEGKEVYIFIAGTIEPQSLTNFPQIQAWINTACPRLVDDQELFNKPVADISEI